MSRRKMRQALVHLNYLNGRLKIEDYVTRSRFVKYCKNWTKEKREYSNGSAKSKQFSKNWLLMKRKQWRSSKRLWNSRRKYKSDRPYSVLYKVKTTYRRKWRNCKARSMPLKDKSRIKSSQWKKKLGAFRLKVVRRWRLWVILKVSSHVLRRIINGFAKK